MHGLWGVNITQRVGLRLTRFDIWSLVHTLNWMYISLAPVVWVLMYIAWQRWDLAAPGELHFHSCLIQGHTSAQDRRALD
jgi:hypothetical protein